MRVWAASLNRDSDTKRDRRSNLSLQKTVEKFSHDVRGNIAMLFVLASSVLFLFIGGAVDYARYNGMRADILESLDAASLAVARMEEVHQDWTTDQLVAYGERFFVENSTNEGVILKSNHAPYSQISEIVTIDLVTDDTKVRLH